MPDGKIENGRRETVTIAHRGGEWTGVAAIAAPDEGDYLRVLVQADPRELRDAATVTIGGKTHAVIGRPTRNAIVLSLTEIHVEEGK